MATAQIPVNVDLSVQGALDPGTDAMVRRFIASLNAKPYDQFRYDLTGAGEKILDVPNNPQMILIVCEDGVSGVVLDFGTDTMALRKGGIFLLVNPGAATGLTLKITHAAAAVVRGMMFG